MEQDRQKRIEERAHRLWEDEGRPDGSHERHWAEAEKQIAAEEADHPDEAVTDQQSGSGQDSEAGSADLDSGPGGPT